MRTKRSVAAVCVALELSTDMMECPPRAALSGAGWSEYRRHSNVEPGSATAVKVTLVPLRKLWEQVEPQSIPDLFAERPLVVFGKWHGQAAGTIRVRGEGGEGTYEKVFDVSDAQSSEANQALRYLWARSRVARLVRAPWRNLGLRPMASAAVDGSEVGTIGPHGRGSLAPLNGLASCPRAALPPRPR